MNIVDKICEFFQYRDSIGSIIIYIITIVFVIAGFIELITN